MDAELRALLALFERTGAPEHAGAYLRAARRAESVTAAELERAAWLGDEGARLALGALAPAVPRYVDDWGRGLERFGLPTVLRAAVAVASAVVMAANEELPPPLRDACLRALSAARAHLHRDGQGEGLRAALDAVRHGRPEQLSEGGLAAFWCTFHSVEATLLGTGRAALLISSQVFTAAVSLVSYEEIVRAVRDELLGDRWPLPPTNGKRDHQGTGDE